MKPTVHPKPSKILIVASITATMVFASAVFREIESATRPMNGHGKAASSFLGESADVSPKPYDTALTTTGFSTGSCSKTRAAVLMFHYFRPESDDAPDSSIRRLSIPPETLEKQVRQLKELEKENKIRLVPMSALDSLAAGKCPADETPVLTVLTVDDAWSDAYDVGFKTFKKYGVPFSLSTISRFTGSGGQRYQGFADRKEISEMVRSGYVHLLSHSLDHKDF
ncbi:MAG: polysaccharide deacetylase family protein [Patescibacteria group bacterium]